MDQQSGSEFTWRFSWWVLLYRVYFFNEVVSKAIKLLLTELVGQCRNILPLAFSALTSLPSVNTEKAAGNIFLHWPPTQLIRVYRFCLEILKMNCKYNFSAEVWRLGGTNLQFLSFFWVNQCDAPMTLGRNSTTGSIFREYVTLGLPGSIFDVKSSTTP